MSQSPEIVLIKQADGKFRLKEEAFSHTSSTDRTQTYCAFNTKRLDSSIPGCITKLDFRKAKNATTDVQLIAELLLLCLYWLIHKAVDKLICTLDN